jgi:hypothetical protein
MAGFPDVCHRLASDHAMAWHIREGLINTDRVQVVIDGAFGGVLHRIRLIKRHSNCNPDQTLSRLRASEACAFFRCRCLSAFAFLLELGILVILVLSELVPRSSCRPDKIQNAKCGRSVLSVSVGQY